MILEGNQRGGARKLARHLLNTQENDHVEVHEISGFLCDTVMGAFDEIYAVSRGTRCKQFLFSVSLNPPHNVDAPPEYFERAIAKIEEKNCLTGQPRVIIFHEKQGRRHAHCVWSRIDADKMKAINLPHYKRKLNSISKQLYLEHGWNLPQGFIDKRFSDPLNFTREEWQQAKRAKEDTRILKQLFKTAWENSDCQTSLQQSLRQYGFWLARGDRRGFVAVDYKGEIYSLSRWMKIKTKPLKQRIDQPELLPDVTQAKAEIAHHMTDMLQAHIAKVQLARQKAYAPMKRAIQQVKSQQQSARKKLAEQQEQHRILEEKQRLERLPKGLKSVWQRITGSYQKIQKHNAADRRECNIRDAEEKQKLITQQLHERQRLQERVHTIRQQHNDVMLDLRRDIGRYVELGGEAFQQQMQHNLQRRNRLEL